MEKSRRNVGNSGGNESFLGLVAKWGKRQLRQPSTYRGLALLATAAGANISPELAASVISAGVSIAGVIDVFKNDSKAGG